MRGYIDKSIKTKDQYKRLVQTGILRYKESRAKMALSNWALTMSQLDIFFPGRLRIELN
ncbi:IS256 family transposase [Wolbachia endosymbiont of Armadillidium vulgare str. wVulC]|nr:IS256 family transposase [Wolbachia endosymbiont of Armadillidium vulgare str. wVulC]